MHMGFLNENDSLAYFAILGELPSGLSFTVGFFKTASFLSLLFTATLVKPWTWFMLNMFCPKVYVQNRCHLCPKCGLNLAKRWLFTSVIQDTNVTVGLKL